MSDPTRVCVFCGSRTNPEAATFCANCGKALNELDPGPSLSQRVGPIGILDRFFQKLWQILTRPGVFFRRMPIEGGVADALAFAIGLSWLSSALNYLWMNALMGQIRTGFKEFNQLWDDFANDPDSASMIDAVMKKMGLSRGAIVDSFTHIQWLFGTSRVLLDPFFTIAWLVCNAIVFWIGAKLVLGNRGRAPVRFDTILKIVAFSSTPVVFSGVIPMAGWLVSAIFSGILLYIGLKEVYRASSIAAILISIFPILAVFAIMMAGFVMFAGLFGIIAAALNH